jgi:polar amino acid transport system substrate-binding protein
LECSLKKLEAGRIDGFIFASREIDTIIKRDHLKNIVRHRYKIFGSKFILPFNKKGEKLDKIICNTIEKMVKDGSLKRVAKPYSSYFQRVYGSPYIPTLKDINN